MTLRLKELNDAIYTVITTQYKKDAKEAHKLVESYGFDIWKYDGHYRVGYKDTHKAVYILSQGWRYTNFYLDGRQDPYKRLESGQECKVDFVRFLTKPKNEEYRHVRWLECQESASAKKYDDIRHAKYMAHSYAEDIENAKKKIDEAVKRLEYCMEMKTRYDLDLAKLRVEYGLV